MMTLDQVRDQIRRRRTEAGSLSALAREIGASAGSLNDLLTERRKPGPDLLAKLGLRAETRYLPLDECCQ